ncbi:MAG: hypothetical protein AMXMBFR33_28820 [Candidatus Xenobia bacterium]
MTTRARELYQKAMQLTSDERAELVELLYASLDEEAENQLKGTLEQRSAELRSGAVKGLPLEEALSLIATPPDPC